MFHFNHSHYQVYFSTAPSRCYLQNLPALRPETGQKKILSSVVAPPSVFRHGLFRLMLNMVDNCIGHFHNLQKLAIEVFPQRAVRPSCVGIYSVICRFSNAIFRQQQRLPGCTSITNASYAPKSTTLPTVVATLMLPLILSCTPA